MYSTEQITLGYEKRDLLSMDETAFFYCCTPVKSITRDRIAGRKHQKERLRTTLWCNEDGTIKLPFLFLGSVRDRATFKDTPLNSLDCNMKAQKSWWFQRWLSQLNEQMRDSGSHILLLIDNVSSHRMDESLLTWSFRCFCQYECLFTALNRGNNQIICSPDFQDPHRHIVERLDELRERWTALTERCEEKKIDSLFYWWCAFRYAVGWVKMVVFHAHDHSALLDTHTQILNDDMHELVESYRKL